MAQVIHTPQAEVDLLEIWVYIAENSTPTTADRFLDSIADKCQILATAPATGQDRSDLTTELRSSPIGNYIIFYRGIEDGIEVIRVLHGARDVRELF
ncbi:MAG: type II toxin-antitoxin system RelE/ParE family toxin [Planctomycetota bacterium]|jgi:toxin ParE1/3/4|nr:type II toxin-antitoxin system RelE/ParE family toxin [Planctomycetota bacterium]